MCVSDESKTNMVTIDTLKRPGVKEDEIEITWVSEAFEMSLISKKLAISGQYDAVITLGTVIRGATPHFDYVSDEVSKGIASASLETGVSIVFGVLTTESIEQVIERAATAIEMVNLLDVIPSDN